MAETYDPMLYDVMKETGYQLGGYYIARAEAAAGEGERQAWLAKDAALQAAVAAVDFRSEAAVRDMTSRLASQIKELRS